MRKLLSQVVAMLLVLVIAAPAAMAVGEKSVGGLAKVSALEGKLQTVGIKMPKVLGEGQKMDAQFRHQASLKDVRSQYTRKNAPKYAPSFAAGSPFYNGVVIYQDGMQYVSEIQMYQFSAKAPCTAEAVSLWALTYGCTYGAVMGAEYYYVTDARVSSGTPYINNGQVYNPETWELVDEVEINSDYSCLGFCAAYDATTGNIYKIGYTADGSGLQLGIFDPATFSSAYIASLDQIYSAMAVGKDGTLYVMDFDGNFGTMDKTTGEVTVIKETGLASAYYTSGAIDPLAETETFYYAVPGDDESVLYAIDCATGESSEVYVYNNNQEITGMFFPRPVAELDAPSTPAIDSVDFPGQALTGTLTFSAPSTLYSGEKAPAGQKMTYEVVANGKVIVSGSNVDYGHSYRVKVAVDEAGLYEFVVIVYNEVGPSPKSKKVTVWVGADAPGQVKNVTAAWAAGKMTINWDAVTTGAHDGAIGNVTYALYDAKTDKLIKEALTETTYTLDVAEPVAYTEYQYYVIATSDGMQSEAGLSNVVALGNSTAPFTTAINATATPDWTIIDSNEDNKKWTLQADAARIAYNVSKEADDWLISSPIVVKKDYLYTVTIMAKAQSTGYPEKFEVKAGVAPTVEAMTVDVLEPTDVKTTTYTAYSGTFMADADMIYLGIHGISDKNMYWLYVNELSIDEGVNGLAPAASSDLNVLVPYSGENKATLSYTTPKLTLGGADLSGNKALTRVEVLVNDKIEYVDNQPTPEAMSSIEIPVPAFGTYTFKVVAYNSYGAGEPAVISAYVGINVPAAVKNGKVTEVSDGVVNITWDQVTTDVDGNVMNPALVTYSIYEPAYDAEGNVEYVPIVEGLTECAYNNYKAVEAGEQDFVQYIIFSDSEAGYSMGSTDFVPVGTPYDLPYADTFENGTLQHILGLGAGDDWSIMNDNSGIVSRNKDNGFLACNTFIILGMNFGYGYAELMTGKIAVTEQNPELSYYFYGISEDCTNTITTTVVCDGEAKDIDVCVTSAKGWKRHVIDMTEYAGKTVQLHFRPELQNYYLGDGYYAFIDDIRLGDPIKVDVVAESITAPATVATEEEFKVDYSVYNQGTSEAKNVFVSLYANGNLVESCVDTLTIAAGQTITGSFDKDAYTLFESGTYQFSFVVDCEADQDLTNNTSDVVAVNVKNSNLPTIVLSNECNIDNEAKKAEVTLTWETPLIDVSVGEVIEGFESASYPAWSVDDFGGWTLENYNTSNTFPVSGVTFPGSGTPFGWILVDGADFCAQSGVDGYAAYEGTMYMAAFAHKSGANDAWLISPQMTGAAQTISFMACALNTSYGPETFKCYYSTTTTDKEAFVEAEVTGEGYDPAVGATEEWVEYSFDIPEGAMYFAIVSDATDTFMLCVDNIKYEGASPFLDLELVGYDVYRDEKKLNTQPLTTESYTETLTEEGTYNYSVVALYNEGKSAPSNVSTVTVKYTQDGVSDAVAGVKVGVEGNEIVVTGAQAVTIAAVDGKVVYAAEADENVRVAVAAGVYVVKADNTVAKVIVK